MGIADRDYSRSRGEGGAGSAPYAHRRSGVGALGLVSVNTWIIAVNVAIFVVGNLLLGSTLVRVDWGTGFLNNVSLTPEQQKNVYVDRQRQLQVPGMQGVYYHPIYAPAIDVQGRQLTNPRGQTLWSPQAVGQERFSYRPVLEGFGHFSTGKVLADFQIWRFLTFQFLHANLTHLLFNMMGLWFIGGLVEEYLGRKRYAAFYLVCGIFGALTYLLLNLIGYIVIQDLAPDLRGRIPALLFDDIYTPLVGASAGVFGVLLAAAFFAPKSIVDVLFILPMRLKTAVYIFAGLAMLNLLRSGPNAGGDAAHVGGAIAGYYFIRRPHLLRDFFEVFGKSRRVIPTRSRTALLAAENAEIDRIVAKSRAEGTASLTEGERLTLRKRNQTSWAGP